MICGLLERKETWNHSELRFWSDDLVDVLP